jgi:hypothetical protein
VIVTKGKVVPVLNCAEVKRYFGRSKEIISKFTLVGLS